MEPQATPKNNPIHRNKPHDQAETESKPSTGGIPASSPVPDAKPTRLRRRKPGDLGQLRAVLWEVLIEVEAIAKGGGDNGEKLRAAHALATLAGSYGKVVEVHDLEERLAALEAQIPRPSKIRRAV